MGILEERTQNAIKMTYRGVGACPVVYDSFGKIPPDLDLFPTSGSRTGQVDFMFDQNHFGSGDIPFKTDDYTTVTTTNSKPFFHIPFQLGAYGIFHSVPDSAGSKVDLDGCTLAKIFSRQIKFWDHADILALNPNLNIPANTPIKVATRTFGSSSTSLTTSYLDLVAGASSTDCPNTWTLGSGSTISWPADVDYVEGSSGMSGYLAANPWAIGYVDSGHGHEKKLKEVELKNKNGKWVTSKTADIAAAGDAVTLPTTWSNSWADISLMNAAGDTTFPICTFSYLYIHTTPPTGDSGRLLQAFVTFVLSDEGQKMVQEFGFVKLSAATLLKARDAVKTITWPSTPWKFETFTGKGHDAGTWIGHDSVAIATLSDPNGEKTFSVKRSSRVSLVDVDVDLLKAKVDLLEASSSGPPGPTGPPGPPGPPGDLTVANTTAAPPADGAATLGGSIAAIIVSTFVSLVLC